MMQTEEDTRSDTSSDYGAIRQRTPVEFDAHGDLRLLVRDERNPSNIDHFIVSSKAMSFACDPWKSMFGPDGPYKEAQKVEGIKEMTLPDNPRALKLLLDIAHLRFSQVSRSLSFEDLAALSIVTDKYQATALVKPWIHDWIRSLSSASLQAGHENWLWIAWEFGEPGIFEQVAARLVRESEEDCKTGVLVRQGRALDPADNNEPFPMGILESIGTVRQQTIDQLLDAFYFYVEKYTTAYTGGEYNGICSQSHENMECDAIILGSLIIGLRQISLPLTRKEAVTFGWSVDELARKIKSVNIFLYPQFDFPPYGGSQ
ncbi:hypothetical protein B0J12DRAFT_736063 [Macrophomina phaseolina]|uniref:Nuclear pore protein n=1 Tax=Macrophomina phaseolina TaxID=35725 RepID=A0ABQ8GQS0_9PEZI|nr:hypothetical protein B0J12DRAFT_736063 [Macrophomina phaseolina]